MANQVLTPNPVSQFNNNAALRAVEGLVPAATAPLANGETLTLTLPAGMPKDALPVSAQIWSLATPALPIAVTITSHNRTTGQTVLTVGAAVAVNSRLVVLYADAAKP